MNLIVLPELIREPALPVLKRTGTALVRNPSGVLLTIQNYSRLTSKELEELGQKFCPDSEEVRHLT